MFIIPLLLFAVIFFIIAFAIILNKKSQFGHKDGRSTSSNCADAPDPGTSFNALLLVGCVVAGTSMPVWKCNNRNRYDGTVMATPYHCGGRPSGHCCTRLLPPRQQQSRRRSRNLDFVVSSDRLDTFPPIYSHHFPLRLPTATSLCPQSTIQSKPSSCLVYFLAVPYKCR